MTYLLESSAFEQGGGLRNRYTSPTILVPAQIRTSASTHTALTKGVFGRRYLSLNGVKVYRTCRVGDYSKNAVRVTLF